MRLSVVDLGRITYDAAVAMQEQLVQERVDGTIRDTLILVEHEPVYTLGRNADPANITATAAQLAAEGIAVRQSTRGGDVTYHGPGQITGYPILSLRERSGGVLWYVETLEQMLIATLAAFGINSATDPVNRGVWIGPEKIAAIGVRVTRQVTMHGFALNVCVPPERYRGIIPCGIRERGVTSMDLHIPDVTAATVKPVLIACFRDRFGYEREP